MNKRLLTGTLCSLALALTSCQNTNQLKELRSVPLQEIYITGKVKGESKADISNVENKRRGSRDECYTLVLETEEGFKTFKFYATSEHYGSLNELANLEALLKEGDEVKLILRTRFPYVIAGGKNLGLRSEFEDLSLIGGEFGDNLYVKEVNGKSR